MRFVKLVVLAVVTMGAGATPASASPITSGDMRGTAVQVTVQKCSDSRSIRTPRGPRKVYSCSQTHVSCHTHPPLRRNVGYCIGSFRLSTLRRSLLPDRICASQMWFVKVSNGKAYLARVPRWYCKDAPQRPPLSGTHSYTRSQSTNGIGPVHIIELREFVGHARLWAQARCFRQQWLSIEAVHIKVYKCRNVIARGFIAPAFPVRRNVGIGVIRYDLLPVRSVISDGKAVRPLRCVGMITYKKVGPRTIRQGRASVRCNPLPDA